jgi:hypothetical protein
MRRNIVILITAAAFILSTALTFTGCTANVRSKVWGGNMNIDLPAHQKLVNATWKDAELWYLTRPMREGEVPETSILHEKSSFGVIEGTVTFIEH